MKKQLVICLVALLCFNVLFADNSRKTADSKIQKVTVFIDGAQITRTGHSAVNSGVTDIIFSNLSPYLDKSSIAVEAKGEFTVLSITQQINHLNEQKKKEETEQLEKRKEEFTKRLEDERSMEAVYDEGVAMLEKNQLVNSQHTDLKTADLKSAMEYHQEKLTELKKTLLTYARNIKKIEDTIVHINEQLKLLNATQSTATSDLVVTVNSKQVTEGDFVISYYVSNAGWFPSYDLRVDDISQPLKIAYRANVHQSTGEDWKNIKLVLSNGEPKSNSTVPELHTWYISNGSGGSTPVTYGSGPYAYRTPDPSVREVKGKVYDINNEPLPFANVMLKGTTVGTTTDANGYYSLQLPYGKNYLKVNYVGYKEQDVPVFAGTIDIRMQNESRALNEVMISTETLAAPAYYSISTKKAKVEEKDNVPTTEVFAPTTYSYEIEMPYSIPDDGKTYTVDIKEQQVNADYIYKCVPKLDKEAFLTARMTGWEDLNLLDGQANLYFEGTYVGQTLLSTSTAEDTLQISLGRDKSVTVNRTKLKDLSKRTFFGDKKVATRAFEISIRNNKKQPINIAVEDQMPVSTQKEIDVDRQEYKEAKLDDATGKLTWNLQIPPATERKMNFKYAVKYPKDYHFVLE